MSEAKAAEADSKAEVKIKKSKLPLIIVGLIVLGGGGSGAFYAVKTAKHKEEEHEEKEKPKAGTLVSLESIIVNLSDPGGNRYLKTTIDLEMALDPEEPAPPPTYSVKLRDKLIMYLSGLTVADLQKQNVKVELKQKVKEMATEIYGEEVVLDAFLKEFVMQ